MIMRRVIGRSAVKFAMVGTIFLLELCAIGAAPKVRSIRPARSPELLPTPTGRIHFKMSGGTMNGTMVFAWLNHGKKFRQEMDMDTGRNGMTMTTWSFTDGVNFYSKLPMSQNQVFRMKIPKDAATQSQMRTQILGQLGVSSGGKPIGKLVGKAVVLGKPCQIRQIGGVKVWIWNGLPMRMEVTSPQGKGLSFIATQLETAPHLSPSLFKVPAGFTVKDMAFPSRAPSAGPTPH